MRYKRVLERVSVSMRLMELERVACTLTIVCSGDQNTRREGTQIINNWLEEYWRAEEEGKMALLLGRSIQGDAGARVDECVMEEVLKWWLRRKELVYGGNPC